jgi:hypothetical protein
MMVLISFQQLLDRVYQEDYTYLVLVSDLSYQFWFWHQTNTVVDIYGTGIFASLVSRYLENF